MATRSGRSRLVLLALVLAAGCRGAGPETREAGAEPSSIRVGIVDFFGVHEVSLADARAALAVKEGDAIVLQDSGRPASFEESERRLRQLPNVETAHLTLVCCEGRDAIVYVGIEERGAPTFRFRPAPTGSVRLPADIVKAGREYENATLAAVKRGGHAEDEWNGLAIARDPAARSAQMRLVALAMAPQRFQPVLRESSDASHRALAAQILGVAFDRRVVVDDLVYGISDPDERVRSNAMRALSVIIRTKKDVTRTAVGVPPDPFLSLMHSPVWTDRNEAALALSHLTEGRQKALLQTVRTKAAGPLAEMARWRSQGHAMPALTVLGRLAGWREEDIRAAWQTGGRDALIAQALGSR